MSLPNKDLVLEKISRRFGAFVALEQIDLTVPAGTMTALLGPSGCGKSTTLRIVAGFEQPDEGRVLIGGRDVVGVPPNRRGLGMVSQDYSLFPHMTVAGNVGYGLRVARVARAELETRVREALSLVRLDGMEDRFPNQLSGGQRQRVALARSLVVNPSVLLLDEPMGALDKALRESMQFELRRIQQMIGTTTVIVTHDQEEALTLSDSVAVMNAGVILQQGTPHEIYQFPRTRFVSEFLGTSNLFEGEVVAVDADSADIRLDGPEPTRFRVARSRADLRSGMKITFAVRPERLRLISEGAASDCANIISGMVVNQTFHGIHHSYQIDIPGRKRSVIVYQQAPQHRSLQTFGTEVRLGWNPDDAVVLED